MTITMPAPDTAKGTVRLIGNPLKFSRTPVSYRSAPPATGADTEAVLSAMGFGEQEIRALKASGAIA